MHGGNIFLELPDDRRPLLSAPPGITTSVLPRSLPSVLHAPGARACVALESWVGEWVHGDHASAEGHAIFVGLTGNPLIERLRSEEHTSELQSRGHLVCRLLLEKKKTKTIR